MKYQKSWTQSVHEVYNIFDDAKMGKQSDDQLKKLYKTASEKDQSSPANKSFTKRIAKEMKKRGINEDKGSEPAVEIINELNMNIEEPQSEKDKMNLKETIINVMEGKVKNENEETELKEILKKGDTVTVPHKGKMVKGKVIRYDKGGPEDPFYVVDVGEIESPKIPAHKIKEDSDPDKPGKQGDKEEYQKKRDAILKKYGVESCAKCKTDAEKKACFNELDKAHVADHEEQVVHEFKQDSGVSGMSDDAEFKVASGDTKKIKKAKQPQEGSTLLGKIKNMMKEKKNKKY